MQRSACLLYVKNDFRKCRGTVVQWLDRLPLNIWCIESWVRISPRVINLRNCYDNIVHVAHFLGLFWRLLSLSGSKFRWSSNNYLCTRCGLGQWCLWSSLVEIGQSMTELERKTQVAKKKEMVRNRTRSAIISTQYYGRYCCIGY